MHKAIYTVEEDLSGVTYLIFFAILWYSFLLRVTITSGFQTRILLFYAAGILVLYQIVRRFQKAFYYRRFHRQCMQESTPLKGRILNIVREYYDEYYEDSDGRRRRRQTFYFMIIEVVDPQTGAVQTIKSDPYRIPLQKYIGSPYVQVYTDRTGWKHVVDGFQLKEKRSDPDIPLENSNVYLKDFNEPTIFIKIITGIIFILFFLQIFFR